MSVQTTYGTTLTVAIEGALADTGAHDVKPMYNAEASAEIAFGRAVKFGSADNAALLPSAEGDKVLGIVLHANAYTVGSTDAQLGTTGLKPGVTLACLRKGRIWAKPKGGVTRGERLWVRAVGSTPPEYLGGLESADDSTDMIDCTAQGVWMTSCADGGLAILEVDFTNT